MSSCHVLMSGKQRAFNESSSASGTLSFVLARSLRRPEERGLNKKKVEILSSVLSGFYLIAYSLKTKKHTPPPKTPTCPTNNSLSFLINQ